MSVASVGVKRGRHAAGWIRLGLLTAILLGALTVVASGAVAAADTTPPEWGNATKGNATTIHVTVYDNGTLDPESIQAEDFALTAGSVANVSVTSLDVDGKNRTGARVSLFLDDRVDTNNVSIGIRSGAAIKDSARNELDEGTVTVSGMDSTTPRYRSFELRRVNESTVEIQAETNERLSDLRVSIGGPATDELNRSNFTESVGDTAVYTARYTFPEEGQYAVLWMSATDRYNNSIRFSRLKKFRYDGSAPNVTLEGPENATVGDPVNFSAANSTDDQRIERYRWRVDGGTIIPGESIRVAFATPGTHEIAVEVTDPFGNTAVATKTVTVATANGSSGTVNLTRVNATHATATVDGTGFAQTLGPSDDRPLVSGTNASLLRVTASLPDNGTVPVALAARNRTPPSLATATGDAGLALFDIDHGGVPAEGVTLRFAVDRAALDRSGVAPEAVTLYRDDGGWAALETTVVERGESRVVYRATAPGLSRFAVGLDRSRTAAVTAETPTEQVTETPTEQVTETPTERTDRAGTPNIRVTNATADAANLSVGDRAVVTVNLTNRGTATGDYLVTLFLNDSTLATREVTVPAGEARTTEFARELPEGGPLEVGSRRVATVSSGGDGVALPGVPTLPSVPNPLALWPSGIVGTILSALVGLVVVVYGILKALAIYLGY
ncbi:PKD domain-containing protein [Haloarcula sp. JP-L23]|uniref:PKD domain-containing protein n=1 Tax=Haloarcula sp. JP-L23 TaxID=2716717 RepID=UPI00140EC0A8|nr:PGF-pre-PGF domain-containing protein [Haloarcula sp. JP-L23]